MSQWALRVGLTHGQVAFSSNSSLLIFDKRKRTSLELNRGSLTATAGGPLRTKWYQEQQAVALRVKSVFLVLSGGMNTQDCDLHGLGSHLFTHNTLLQTCCCCCCCSLSFILDVFNPEFYYFLSPLGSLCFVVYDGCLSLRLHI